MPTQRTAGENALERVVRLLDRFNDRFADLDVPGMEDITVTFNRRGQGTIQSATTELYTFGTIGQLAVFLDQPVAAQIAAVRNNA